MFWSLESGSSTRLNNGCESKRDWTGRSTIGAGFVGQILGKRMKKLIFGQRSSTNRQRCHGLLCRLPVLALWTLIVIVILYKCTTNTNLYDETSVIEEFIERKQTIGLNAERLQAHPSPATNAPESPTSNYISEIEVNQKKENIRTTKYNQANKRVTSRLSNQILSTTREYITDDFSRRNDVFILVVKDEDLQIDLVTRRLPMIDQQQSSAKQVEELNDHLPIDRTNIGRQKVRVPNHIKYLTEILDSHKIGYTIDTTRFGLPETLLSNTKRHSVLVIDDFVHYSKLNRWVRDRLDRHCRSHNIGVMTFLMDDRQLLNQREILRSTSYNMMFNNHVLQQRSATQETITSDHKTLGDQFPISFKIVKQECKNVSSNDCLIDYQVSERAQILRVLRQKPNFIIPGELEPNLNDMPFAIMSSNHISYEPITWARLRQARTRRHAHDNENDGSVTSAPSGMRQRNHYSIKVGVPLRLKRAALSSTAARPKEELASSSPQLDRSQRSERLIEETHENESDQSALNEVSSSGQQPLVVDDESNAKQILAMFDRGLYDGIKRVIFGFVSNHWLNRILVLDAIEHLSSGDILSPLDRFIQIDIDDIFVGEQGTRLNRSDVDAMIGKQNDFATFIDGFKFNLGFSGKFYQRGNEIEKQGGKYLLQRASEFTWFCHFFSHAKAHLFGDVKSLATEIMENLQFAKKNKLPLVGYSGDQLRDFLLNYNGTSYKLPATYAVAPHHSGVYPIHEQLYEVWRTLLNVQVTSTEEYPHLRPVSARRAFVHKTIKVLPRQTCGLYTHTIYKRKYPGGFGKLLESINGGELFETVLHNFVNIYMTHMSNYANDRLALFTFTKLFDFVRENTNIRLRYSPSCDVSSENLNQNDCLGPNKLAQYYFAVNPLEREPLWTNPCTDKRHLAIWAPSKHHYCDQIPSIIIVGPQKSGTTALYTFLKLNPQFRSSRMSKQDFEEIQFFNDKHYLNGIDWYFEQFESDNADETKDHLPAKFFDKSATYFDDSKAPRRASALLPDAQIISILIDPADRAYSWYQHMKAHGNLAANKLTFEEVLNWSGNETATITSTNRSDLTLDRSARALRQRCLHPGYFASHLVNWLKFYPTRQITIIDGEWFRYNPMAVLKKLQAILHVQSPLDYSKLLIYDEQKGFYCYRVNSNQGEGVKCLGSSKGRKYQTISEGAKSYLNRHYWQHNKQLANLLYEIGQPLPLWLDKIVNI